MNLNIDMSLMKKHLPRSLVASDLEFAPLSQHKLFIDLTGETYPPFVVLGYKGTTKRGASVWWVRCLLCNRITYEVGSVLRAHTNQSCGCARRNLIQKAIVTHGGRYTPEYSIYSSAKSRCNNPAVRSYKDYGGRGIEFRFTSFVDFLDALGPRPSPQHTVDRINNNGHYEAGNVRWATRLEQAQNKRKLTRFK